MSSRKILLLEPNYKNKYPPMGLMKLATYYRCRNDDVRFFKGDLKGFAARLLYEEYAQSIDIQSNSVDSVILAYSIKRGVDKIIEYIKTGKRTPLDHIANFSELSSECPTVTFEMLLKRLDSYRIRYKNGDYPKFDKVAITTLFTFYWKETIETILFAKKLCNTTDGVLVGGIAASLVPEHIEAETGIVPHVGLLDKPYIYDEDKQGNVVIDELPLDYSILDEIEYVYPAADAYFAYMTRGCVNHCAFCAVPKLEPHYSNYISIKEKIKKTEECFGKRRNLLLMDNNVFASSCFNKIIDEIKECGFENGATYIPNNEYDIAYNNLCEGFKLSIDKRKKAVKNDRAYIKKIVRIYDVIANYLATAEEKGAFYTRREELGLLFPETATEKSIKEFHELVKPLTDRHLTFQKRRRYIDFNQGLDSRLAHEEKMDKISQTAIRPLRIAFDHWKMRDAYEASIRKAARYGIREMSNYLLYNFKDHPDELYNRMRLNIDLCEELEVNIYSFPMKYHPIDDPAYFRSRDYIGQPHWNRKFIRAIQAVLNSTHGKIGRGKTFFEAAFGKDIDEFHKILWMPEALIIQRYKYDEEKRIEYYGAKKSPYDDCDKATGQLTSKWWESFCALSPTQREVAEVVITGNKFTDIESLTQDAQILDTLQYYTIKRSRD